MVESFGARLQARIRELGPLCVGIDPSAETVTAWGRADTVEGLEFCSLATLEAVVGVAAVVKPQVAFFERFGSGGFRVLERVIAEAHDADLLVIADAKRGDVATTNEGYASAWLDDRSPLCVDAVTVHPYLGLGALAPFFERAEASGRGVLVLAATSNPESRVVQSARTPENERVEDAILLGVAELNQRDDGRGSIGAVVGATRQRPQFDLARLGGPYLVPGVGAQGAGASDVAQLFERCPSGTVLASVSRDVSRRGPERAALRDAAQRWRDDLSTALL
jgi:orotidine-5'-phosphate decarboxylase